MRRTGFICGLASETDCLLPLIEPERLRIAGGRPGAAERCARELIAAGCERLVSFGLAGGLAADATPGQIVVARDVVSSDGTLFLCEDVLSNALAQELHGARWDRMLGSDTVVASPDAKADLYRRHAAYSVDMETHWVAREASKRAVSFAAVRAITDPASARIPDAVLDAIDERGRPRTARIVLRLARHPSEISDVLKLARHARAAHASLRRVAPALVRCLDGL